VTAAVFIAPLGYGRYCRLAVIGLERHATACLASIPADEPVLLTARRPLDRHLCAACLADMRVREPRGDDLTPWRGQIGAPVLLTVERAAEELFGPVVSRTATPLERPEPTVDPVTAWDERSGTVRAQLDDAPGPDVVAIRAVLEHEDLLGDGESA
jgi:hypothetical protein